MRLGAIEGEIGAFQQRFRIRSVDWGERYPDACADVRLMPLEIVRGGEGLDDAPRQGGCFADVGAGAQDGEFVAAQARREILLADERSEAPGDHAQKRVSGRVPERVVDFLEAVEVEEKKRGQARRLPDL